MSPFNEPFVESGSGAIEVAKAAANAIVLLPFGVLDGLGNPSYLDFASDSYSTRASQVRSVSGLRSRTSPFDVIRWGARNAALGTSNQRTA